MIPLVCGVLAASCGGSGSRGERTGAVIPAVEAVRARHGALPLAQRLSGVVEANNQVAILPQVDALITEVLVDDGDAVEAGDPLVRLRDTEFRQRLNQAQASGRIAAAELRRARALAAEARADLARRQSLVASDLSSPAELETARARSEAAEADVELAEARVEQSAAGVQELEEDLSKTVVRAPIAGRVGSRRAEVGMLATSSARLFTLGRLDSVRVEVTLTDRMLTFIEPGQRAEILLEGAMLPGSVSRISPFLNPVTHSTEAEIDLPNPSGLLKPGMFVAVDIFYGESREATLVPLTALYEDPATGVLGVFLTDASLSAEASPELDADTLSDPVPFRFVRGEVVAQGRLEAGILGVDPGTWVVTVGQNLLDVEGAEARVRAVPWERVERLQRLQREDLMEGVIQGRSLQ